MSTLKLIEAALNFSVTFSELSALLFLKLFNITTKAPLSTQVKVKNNVNTVNL